MTWDCPAQRPLLPLKLHLSWYADPPKHLRECPQVIGLVLGLAAGQRGRLLAQMPIRYSMRQSRKANQPLHRSVNSGRKLQIQNQGAKNQHHQLQAPSTKVQDPDTKGPKWQHVGLQHTKHKLSKRNSTALVSKARSVPCIGSHVA
jgi:hypothetical protein